MDSTQVQKRHQTACALRRRTTDAALLKCVAVRRRNSLNSLVMASRSIRSCQDNGYNVKATTRWFVAQCCMGDAIETYIQTCRKKNALRKTQKCVIGSSQSLLK